MRKIDHHLSLLPPIETFKTQPKPIKDIMKDLQQRKLIIESRLKTQMSSSDHEDRDEIESHLRDRIITDVSYYSNKTSFYRPLEKTECLGKVKEYSPTEKIFEMKEKSSERSMKVKIDKTEKTDKRKSIKQSFKNHTVLEKREPAIKSRKEISHEVEKLLEFVPIDPLERNEKNIFHLKNYLVSNNMFFAKIHEILATCLLKLNRVIFVGKNEVIYRMGEEKKAFYLILSGRVKLYSSELKIKQIYKICGSGESVGEEIIFTPNSRKVMCETAKATSSSFLIELKMENYRKMNEEMIKFGYKLAFNEMESIIKRNFITKNWLRSEKSRMEGVK